jgi:uncharacterized protein (DUF488 family)
MAPNVLYTVGHSNRPLGDFLALLAENDIQTVADVRRFPGSRRHPQFASESLAASLAGADIAYSHVAALGGRRTARDASSPNSVWRIAAFAAYADYMLTDDFARALAELKSVAEDSRTAIMCAEALPWRCHRRLIADQFMAESWQVLDIIGPHNTKPHELPDFATITDGQVSYAADTRPLFDA